MSSDVLENTSLAEGVHTLLHGGRAIVFRLEYKPRKTLGIVVHPSGEVIVRVPEGARSGLIHTKLARRAPWILRQLDAFAAMQAPAPIRRHVTGETVVYWGRNLRLRVVPGRRGQVRYAGQWLEVACRKPEQAGRLVEEWLRNQVRQYLTDLMERWLPRFEAAHGVSPEGIFLQAMERRWGSCTPRGRILINPALIAYPKSCLEYVLVHELLHLVVRGHGRNFWELLHRELPGWEKSKRKLETQ